MKPIALAFALLAAGFYGSAEAAITTDDVIKESEHVILASRAAAACANIDGCVLESGRASDRVYHVFNTLTGQGDSRDRVGYYDAMAAVDIGVWARIQVACRARLAHGQARLVTTGVPMDVETRADLEECAK